MSGALAMSYKDDLMYMREYITSHREEIERAYSIEKAKKFIGFLDRKGILYDRVIKHKKVMGCSESQEEYSRFGDYIDYDYSICKHILVKERKGDKIYLIIVDHEKQVDLSKIREDLGCKKLEFVSSDLMKELIDTDPGNVSIFNIMKDKEQKVEVVMDKELDDYSRLVFHPLYNEFSMFIKPEEVFKFMDSIDRGFTSISVPSKDKAKQFVK